MQAVIPSGVIFNHLVHKKLSFYALIYYYLELHFFGSPLNLQKHIKFGVVFNCLQ